MLSTVIVIVVVAEPAAFVAVMAKGVATVRTVGVPEITPVEELRVSPAGKVALAE